MLPDQRERIERILARLDAATVSGNWRIAFRFEGGDASDVDLIDYH